MTETFQKKPGPAYLPGDPAPSVEAMIRVDHAGEFGAVRIYEGQLAVLPPGPARDAVAEMAAQEQEHLETFNELIVSRRVRPTALSPLWHFEYYASMESALLVARSLLHSGRRIYAQRPQQPY